jgi:hypothetical protein
MFISILCLFYFNIFSINKKNLFFYYFYQQLSLFISFFFFFFNFNYLYILESDIDYQQPFFNIYDNFYEALFNNKNNDLAALRFSYYIINSLELIFIGILLLFGSMIVINLYWSKHKAKLANYSIFFLLFDLINDLINNSFLRKQDLNGQNSVNSAVRFFKKKI